MSHAVLKPIGRKSAAHDIVDALRMYKTWGYLSYQDVISRYRRSILGPFWVAGLMISQALAMSLVFGGIFGMTLKEFLPYVVGGLSIILFVGSAFGEGAETYTIYANVMSAHNLPITFHIFRMCCRQLVIFLHYFVVFLIVYIAMNGSLSISPLVVPALALNFLFLFACTLMSACLSLRFRDFKFLLPHVWLIVFYLTPVIWKPSQIGAKFSALYQFNPIYYLLEIMRGSMLGTPPAPYIWINALIVTLGVLVLSYVVFALMRRKMTLWL
jgi:ABC-type polysaccharide/polyol phosphate export permease